MSNAYPLLLVNGFPLYHEKAIGCPHISFLVNLERGESKFPLFRAGLAIYRSWVTTKQGKCGIGMDGNDPEGPRDTH